jgi:membrane protein CcdC involved in cytochrome C biogenesis
VLLVAAVAVVENIVRIKAKKTPAAEQKIPAVKAAAGA